MDREALDKSVLPPRTTRSGANRPSPRRLGAERGFALVELVVVVLLIGLLTTILLPVLGRVRDLGMRAQCAANLHTLGIACSAYAMSNQSALPEHFAAPNPPFDSFWMRQDGGELVNLGLLVPLADAQETFYCPSHEADTNPDIAQGAAGNKWGGPRGKGHGPPPGANSSFSARARWPNGTALATWSILHHGNKVIYSDFIGVDDWPGRGRFRGPLFASHAGEGCNRLFGDGSALWCSAAPLNDLRPVGPETPTPEELMEYYELLDVLPG